ncbi:MAG: flavin reductase [Christensenella sp.]|jgi:flavorubredoxin/flavin reductase (DIM6/NTAB) family NADH-FMN oxidoreductase RutF|nr:flavin reductase [Christensenella sp.]
MHHAISIREDLFWVGGNDRRLALFENVFPIPRGVSYNAYVLLDEKTVLFDTVDKSVSGVFFESLAHVLAGRKLDYLIVNHMEPDHAATMEELVLRYPEVTIVTNAKAVAMIRQFFLFDVDARCKVVAEGDTLTTGRHTLAFLMAPMVHWPEAMVTYDATTKTLFSADAFGTFGALSGNLFADEVDFERDWLDDARRYYVNIVGKYGTQVQALLKKAATVDIDMICPLHGPVWRTNLSWFIEKYQKWSTYTPEDNAVMIAYASVYGNTENAANILASKLAARGVKKIAMYDVSATHPSVIVSEAFRCSHLVFASTTYNAGIFCNMETALLDIAAHNLQNRTVALIENGSWAATAGKLMAELLGKLKNITVLDNKLTIKSSLKEGQLAALDGLADAIAASLKKEAEPAPTPAQVESNAMFKLSYGLFVLTARDGAKDNGCIINTAQQLTSAPMRISITVNKANYTHDMIEKTGAFNISVLTEGAPFGLFKQYGFQSGRTADKLSGGEPRTENGIAYLSEHANAVISGKVISTVDCGTHTLFIADVTEAHVLSAEPSVTYAYYFAHIKPKPQPAAEKKKGFVCKICGYVYEGETLPPDFICPLCKHGAEDFEPLQ